jgi:hypothetical protein
MTTKRITTKRITTTLAALTLMALLGACSGSDDGDDVASVSGDDSVEEAQVDEADAEAELLDWVECMNGEGFDVPEPIRDSDGNLVLESGVTGSGVSATPEDMEAAEEACGRPPPLGASNVSEEDQQAMQDAALEFAQCMREQGIEDFPDPDFSDMGPGGDAGSTSSDDSEADGPARVFSPFGDIDMDDPETRAAFEACQEASGGGPGGPVGGGGT